MIASTSRKLFVLLNPVSGQADPVWIRLLIARAFPPPDWTVRVHVAAPGENLPGLVRAACAAGADRVVAAGGDGTVAAAANGLRGTDVPLGILPVGTGNILARALGIPLDLESAARLIAGAHALLDLDALEVGGRLFLLNVSVGITSHAMRDTDSRQKKLFGMLAYAWTLLLQSIGVQPRRFVLTVDGRAHRLRASEILVSNAPFLREPPHPVGPPAAFCDARLDVYVLKARSLLDILRALAGWLIRSRKRRGGIRRLPAEQRILIDAAGKPLPVQADGDWIGRTPVDIRVIPGAVRVVAPEGALEVSGRDLG